MVPVRAFTVALVSFLVLDGLWLGVVMSGFYLEALGPIARKASDGSLAPLWHVAFPVYVLLALGQVWFVMPRVAGDGMAAARWGALFGLVVYGVYDFTNWSVLKDYGATIALVDVAWGMFACAAVAVILNRWGR